MGHDLRRSCLNARYSAGDCRKGQRASTRSTSKGRRVRTTETPRRMLSEKQILDLLPIARSTLQKWEREGDFPRSVHIGPNRKAWFEDEVIEWQNRRKAA